MTASQGDSEVTAAARPIPDRTLVFGVLTPETPRFRLSGRLGRRLLGLAEKAMPGYLEALRGIAAALGHSPLLSPESPLVERQGWSAETLRQLVLRGWVMDLAVGGGAHWAELSSMPAGGLVLEMGGEYRSLAPTAFGLNLSRAAGSFGPSPAGDVTSGEIWMGWPPGPAWTVPGSVLSALPRALDPTGPPELGAEVLRLRHFGLLRRRDDGSVVPAVPVVDANLPESAGIIGALEDFGRELLKSGVEQAVRQVSPGPERIALLRIILELGSFRGEEAGLLPRRSSRDVLRWAWLGRLPFNMGKWL